MGGAAFTAALALTVAFYAKFNVPVDMPPEITAEWSILSFDPYPMGLLFQSIVIPLALLYIFSTTGFFKEIVSHDIPLSAESKLLVILISIQLVTQGYQLWLAHFFGEPSIWFTPLVIIVIGGLLGGWRVGASMSVVNLLFSGSCELWQVWGAEFAMLFRMGGWHLLLTNPPWGDIFLIHYVLQLQSTSVFWAGITVAFLAELFDRRQRLSVWGAIGLGATAETFSAYLTHVAGAPPGLARLIPAILISALTMIIFALLVRNANTENVQQRLKSAELARTRAELRALRAQINPHFLFNALNTIRYFVRVDPPTARRLLLNLSELFQRVIYSGEFVSVEDEIGYTKAYLALEKARLDQRLQVEWHIAESVQLSSLVPTLILQPLVENAVIHGIAPKAAGGKIRIDIEQTAEMLLLRVQDDGMGISPERLSLLLQSPLPQEHAIGLRNVNERLQTLYGKNHRLQIQSETGRGTTVVIKIPAKGEVH